VDGPNVYTYVKQNPWTKFDPEGLKPESVNEFTHPDTGRTVGLMQMPGEFQRGYSKARGQAASLGADFTPILGGFKGAYEAAIGKDAITKEPLTTGQRVGAGIGTAVSWIPGGKAGVKGLARLLTRGAKDVDKGAKTARGITKTSEKVVETVIQAEGPAAKGIGTAEELGIPKFLNPRQNHHIPPVTDGRSVLTADPSELLEGLHDGAFSIMRQPKSGQVSVDFGKTIGEFWSQGVKVGDTQFGSVLYGKKGVHFVPANPKQW
jgi:hypothetical protein